MTRGIASTALVLLSSTTAAIAMSSSTSTPSSHVCTATLDGQLPNQTPINFHPSGNVRKYYVAAEEIDWDYAPSGYDNWLGVPLAVSPRARKSGYTKYGTKWKKAAFRGYTDSTFTSKTPQPEWQGIQGPTIRSEVGDLIEILFTNKLSHQYASMHSMGLAYSKDFEGSDYVNATSPSNATIAPGDAVPPGGCVVYKWLVSDGAAPAKGEPATMHGYHGYVSEPEDVNTGLIGPQMTYQRGMMNHTMSNYREIPLLFMGFDESGSWLSGQNAKRLTNSTRPSSNYSSVSPGIVHYGNETFWRPQLVNLLAADKFPGAPEFYSLNGYVYSNNPVFKMCLNENVIWYVYGKFQPSAPNTTALSLKANSDPAHGMESHSFHMHGNGFTSQGVNMATYPLQDGQMASLYMQATGAGLWQLICHVDDHLAKGMVANYWVMQDNCPPSTPGEV